MQRTDRIIVGIDIGGTKTEIAVLRSDVAMAKRIVSTDGWRIRNPAADSATLMRLVRDMTADEGPVVIVVGAHGCDSTEECLEFQTLLAGHSDAEIIVLNDAELLLHADPGAGEGGIAVIAGTGSIAATRLDDGRLMTAGGWGWFLGDEGSASGLVREAARAVRGAVDRGEPDDGLQRRLMDSLGLVDPIQLGRTLVARGSAAAVGYHVQALFAAAATGSPLARAVIADGGQALARLAETLVGRGAKGNRIALGGGVITRQPALMAAFEAGAKAALPDWRISLVTCPPVEGALNVARRRLAGESPMALRLAGRPTVLPTPPHPR